MNNPLEHVLPNAKQRARALVLAEDLFTAFAWQATDAGYFYWKEVHDRLRELGGGNMQAGVDRERVREAQDLLITAFVWEDTEQGHEYWQTVYDNLGRLAAGIVRGEE
jgi:uncharacterized protein (DUF2249 family)